jgi:hypothetical protein
VLFLVLGVTKWYIMHSFFGVIIVPFFLVIIRDSEIFFSCPVRIEVFSVVFLVSTFSPAKAIDRFFVVLSASAKSFF